MADIRPVEFPRIAPETVKKALGSKPRPRKEINRPNDKIQETGKNQLSARVHVASELKQPGPTKQATFEKSVEILKAKSLELYHPGKAKKIETVQLGQIIDIKI